MIKICTGLIDLIFVAVLIAICGGFAWISLAIWKSVISMVLSL